MMLCLGLVPLKFPLLLDSGMNLSEHSFENGLGSLQNLDYCRSGYWIWVKTIWNQAATSD